ncbi:hypothetical protein BdWA1_001266 [Babesia duncani]|uniref:Uncharacterized protein n=1 Tax=Babesia duncani TaxID=323732 RepID=A0AAD9PPF5_9APIC|nr:hypothetical protein BdWA1_001266 [Babesia duncani]
MSREGARMEPQISLPPPSTGVMGLGDIDLNMVIDDLETTCSPFSESMLGKKNGGYPESISSENPHYLWYVKNRAKEMRQADSRHVKSATIGCNSDSDVASTCGMVNMRYATQMNMCENPSDMWYGLKMLDGTPVYINSSKRPRNNQIGKGRWRSSRMRNGNIYDSLRLGPNWTSAANSSFDSSLKGPIDYSGGFLSIGNYIENRKLDDSSSAAAASCQFGK